MDHDESTRSVSALRLRVAAQSIALAVLMSGIATVSILVFRGQFKALHWFRHSASVARSPRAAASRAGAPSAAALNLSHDQALVPVSPEPALPEAPPKNKRAPEPRYWSAAELYARAEQARGKSDVPAAIALCRELDQTFPSSTEGISAHLLLGVLYLQDQQPNRALGEFAIYRHIGDPETLAEALWGQAQALRQLERPSDEREILEELLKSYPRSIYAAAAKQRVALLRAPALERAP
jgi:TolA-binding protein